MSRFLSGLAFAATALVALSTIPSRAVAQTTATHVVAFWGFANDYDFSDGGDGPNKQDFAADVDNTVGSANLQMYLGVAANMDDNGGGGFSTYTSPVSGATFDTTRTAKWDDLKGGGDPFSIGTEGSTFSLDKSDGTGASSDDFGNDALVYFTFDGSGFVDLELRFDIEGTPGDLPASFDIFYRTSGTGGTWFRDTAQNNIPLTFLDYPTPDPENMFSDSGYHALNSALNNQSQIEIIVGDFAEFGNGEMELDNIEIVGNVVPEPSSAVLLLLMGLVVPRLRRSVGSGSIFSGRG